MKSILLLPATFLLSINSSAAHAQSDSKESILTDWELLPVLPDTPGFAGAFAGVSDDALLVAGGTNFPDRMPWEDGTKVWYDTIYVLESPEGPWKTGFKLPRPLAYGVSVTTPRGVVCAGGCDSRKNYADVYRLCWVDSRIEIDVLPPLPEPASSSCGALVGTTIYIAGGQPGPNPLSGPSMRNFWALDLSNAAMRWRQLEPWPGPERFYAIAAAVGDSFYLIGGIRCVDDGSNARLEYLHDAYRFTPASGMGSGRWERLPDLPRPRAAIATPAPTLQDRFIALLGSGADGTNLDVSMAEHPGFGSGVLLFDTSSDRWIANGQMPVGRAAVSSAWWRERIVIPTGEVRPGVRSPEVYWALPNQ